MRDLMNNLNVPMQEVYVRKILKQMLLAVGHCHKNGVVHRDVKLENFLIKSKKGDDFTVKLTDFGIACLYDEADKPTLRCGTSVVMAPEIIDSQPYSPKIDCWALGIILYELLSNELPYWSEEPT